MEKIKESLDPDTIWYMFIIKAAYERLNLRASHVGGTPKFRIFTRIIAVIFALT